MKLLLEQNVRQQLKATLQEGAQKGKVREGQKRPSMKKGKGNNGESYILTVVLFKRKKTRIVRML